MTTNHNIHLPKYKTDFKATYRDGKFRKLEHLRGTLSQEILNALGNVVPKDESELEAFKLKFAGKVEYTSEAVKPKTNFTKFMDAWKSFYKKEKGFYPKIDVAERVSLVAIIKYLKSINTDDEDAALLNWQLILDNWAMLPDFYQKKTDLKKINSNFNVIITELKSSIKRKTGDNHVQAKQKANDIANKYF